MIPNVCVLCTIRVPSVSCVDLQVLAALPGALSKEGALSLARSLVQVAKKLKLPTLIVLSPPVAEGVRTP